jgi:hypothetical protein
MLDQIAGSTPDIEHPLPFAHQPNQRLLPTGIPEQLVVLAAAMMLLIENRDLLLDRAGIH